MRDHPLREPLIVKIIRPNPPEFTPLDAAKRILLIIAAGFAMAVLSAWLASEVRGADYASDWPFVEQSIDTIAVCHIAGENGGFSLVFFFDRVQGEWTCLDHRWLASDMAAGYDAGRRCFTLTWRDESDSCHRLIRAAAWVESHEQVSPLAVECDKPWHARLLEPGLKKARGPF